MTADSIEFLKSKYTDRYVEVDASRPELARFRGKVAQVKTVNQSGRALLQFEGEADHGWYDIAVEYLRFTEKPAPKPEPAKPAAKPAAKKPEPKVEQP